MELQIALTLLHLLNYICDVTHHIPFQFKKKVPFWTPESFRPYIAHCLAVFGAERCMFGRFQLSLHCIVIKFFLFLATGLCVHCD